MEGREGKGRREGRGRKGGSICPLVKLDKGVGASREAEGKDDGKG